MTNTGKHELISAPTPEELTQLVNEKLAEGWKLYKNPFADQGQLFQATILERKTEKRLRKTSEDG